MTNKGLYCPSGNFYIDPNSGVERAVITHAHSDHARKGSKQYYCTTSGVSLLKARLGNEILVNAFDYGKKFTLGPINISFHSAGHILGSSQIRLESPYGIWLVSGDYKREIDGTCEPFESVTSDVFITEGTFATPAFRWPKNIDIGAEIFDWWATNQQHGLNSVLFAYSLGKTQRILNALARLTKQPIYCDSAAQKINNCYKTQGIHIPPTIYLNEVEPGSILNGELFIVPPKFLNTEKAKIVGERFKTAFASGWMTRPNPQFHHGFVLSDHADWDDLLRTVQETKAKHVYVQHRGNGALVRQLITMGIKAYPATALYPRNPDQLELF